MNKKKLPKVGFHSEVLQMQRLSLPRAKREYNRMVYTARGTLLERVIIHNLPQQESTIQRSGKPHKFSHDEK